MRKVRLDDVREKDKGKGYSVGLRYWNANNDKYPFQIHEDRNGNRVPFNDVRGAVYAERYGDFLRCPAPEIGVILWGFITEQARADFALDYGLESNMRKGMPA